MTGHHQFSKSLFNKLFKHNMVTSDGFIKATDPQLMLFRKFLEKETAQKTAALYKIRKEMVDEVLSLLQEDSLNPRQRKRLVTLLHKLNMRVTENGTLEGVHQPIAISSQAKTSEAPLSVWEQKMETEKRRLRGMNSDLKELNDWLKEISKPASKAKSESGDGQKGDGKHQRSKKKVPKKQSGVRSKKSSGTNSKKDKISSRVTFEDIVGKSEHLNNQKDARNTCSKEKLEPYPQESLDVILSKEERDKSNKNASNRRKGSFDKDSIISEISNEGSLDEVDSSKMVFGEKTGWKHDFKTKVFGSSTSTPKTRKKRKELLTHVHDVTMRNSSDFQDDDEDALSDILKTFPMLQRRGYDDDDMARSSEGWDDDSWEDDEDGEDILFTKKGTEYHGKGVKMAEDLVPADLELSLDEILRMEAAERSQRKCQSQNKQ